jgi:hypothetical protein
MDMPSRSIGKKGYHWSETLCILSMKVVRVYSSCIQHVLSLKTILGLWSSAIYYACLQWYEIPTISSLALSYLLDSFESDDGID